MNKLLSNIITIIIIVCTVIFLQHKFFPTEIIEYSHSTDTIWQDTGRVVYIPKAYPVYIDTGSVKVVELPADSAAITAAYLELHKYFYSTYFYKDTIVDDSTMFIEINAEISQNKPVKYISNWIDRTPSIINNTTNIYAQNEFYVGIGVGVDELNANLLFKSKKSYIFEVGYDPFRSNFEVKGYVGLNKLKFW